ARRYNASGEAEGDAFRINDHVNGGENATTLAQLADGRIVATWQSNAQDGSGAGVYGKLIALDGQVTDSAAVGQVNVDDPDFADTHSFVLIDDANGRFSIDSTTGVITLADTSQVDYDDATSHDVVVRVTDSGGKELEQTLTIAVAQGNPDTNPPIVIDLDGDGLEILTADESNVTLDVDGDGDKEQTAWVGADDGFIITDLDGDGSLSSNEELFIAQQTAEDDTDLEALATLYDSNKDGVINRDDDRFDELMVFQDKDQDGVADKGEVISLTEAGIEEISVMSNGQRQELEDGSVIHGTSTYTRNDGSQGIIGDVSLAYQSSVAPRLLSALASENTLILSFSEKVSGNPQLNEFVVTVDDESREVVDVTVTNEGVRVLFDGAPLTNQEQLTFDYIGTSLQDDNANQIETIDDQVAGRIFTSESALENLLGDAGDDIFFVNDNNVTITGGGGAETINFNVAGTAEQPAELFITDFNTGNGDLLNIGDVLIDDNENIDELLHFEKEGDDTIMEIKSDVDGEVTGKVTFKDTDLFMLGGTDAEIINNLLDNGNLDNNSDL
ncbi:MAG: type I secretion C-terminal target domain-containing protein, partial [Endozoicomonas sp. (ex Botrylloides leachii)]|nr:type I secretion C-terminal target domain-containing protein [Endozoicomonas sp. (ex Botrylloides leachii)]